MVVVNEGCLQKDAALIVNKSENVLIAKTKVYNATQNEGEVFNLEMNKKNV